MDSLQAINHTTGNWVISSITVDRSSYSYDNLDQYKYVIQNYICTNTPKYKNMKMGFWGILICGIQFKNGVGTILYVGNGDAYGTGFVFVYTKTIYFRYSRTAFDKWIEIY